MTPPHRGAVLLGTICLAALACRLNLGGPEIPAAGNTSPAAATRAASAWSEALAGAVTTGQITVILNEEELTSALAARVESSDDPVFHSPVVQLRDGVIQIYGIATSGPVDANVRFIVTPTIDVEGQLRFELSSADFGPLPAPESMRKALSDMLSEALGGTLGTLATGFRVTSVAVDDGDLAIVAEMR